MQADLQYLNPSGSNPDTHVTVTVVSTYVFSPIVNNPIPQINAGGVVNAASLRPKVAPGSLASIFGSNLAGSNASAGSPLTTSLGGTSVTIGGHAAPLLFVSATQINCQVPFEVPAGSPADVIVTNGGQTSNTVSVNVGDYAVGVFTYARTSSAVDPIVTHTNYQLVTPANPALPNEALIVYATGIGKLTDRPSTGAAASSSPLATAWDEPTVTVGGSPAQMLFAGLAPNFVGVVQFNIQLPPSVPAGNLAMVIDSLGDASSSVNLAVGNAQPQQPSLSLSTAGLAFGNVTVGQTRDLTLTVSNTGSAQLTVSALTASGPFSVVSPVGPLSVAAAASIVITVRFSPRSGGAQSGALTIASNDPAHPTSSVTLAGTGAASDVVLQVDGGTFNKVVGFSQGTSTAVFVNRLTPPSYPATLKNVQIYFANRANGLPVNSPITIVAAANSSSSSSFSVASAGALNPMPATVNALGVLNTYVISTPITITAGDFLVGFMTSNPVGVFPADQDQITPSQGRSYVSTDGLTFTLLDSFSSQLAGNLGIRATVTLTSSGH
jgi:uncharacterized protein (TIGR03437 family)